MGGIEICHQREGSVAVLLNIQRVVRNRVAWLFVVLNSPFTRYVELVENECRSVLNSLLASLFAGLELCLVMSAAVCRLRAVGLYQFASHHLGTELLDGRSLHDVHIDVVQIVIGKGLGGRNDELVLVETDIASERRLVRIDNYPRRLVDVH